MNTNSISGRNTAVAIGAYIIAKSVVNMLIGHWFSIVSLLLAVVLALALYSGVKYVNYAVAVMLAVVVLKNFPYNITHLPSTVIYLAEGIADAVCAVLLCFNSEVKKHFTNGISIKS